MLHKPFISISFARIIICKFWMQKSFNNNNNNNGSCNYILGELDEIQKVKESKKQVVRTLRILSLGIVWLGRDFHGK